MEAAFATNVRQWVDQSKLQWIRFQNNRHLAPVKDTKSPNMTAASSLAHAKKMQTNFQVHPWRWHHLGIVYDLKRFRRATHDNSSSLLCLPSGSGLGPGSDRDSAQSPASRKRKSEEQRRIKSALRYILEDNWAVHDIVEDVLLFPWLKAPPSLKITPLVIPNAIISERARLRQQAKSLSSQFGQCCDTQRQLDVLLADIDDLADNAERLFEASEALVISHVAQHFPIRDQKKFNDSVLSTLSSKQVRIAAVSFRDAVDRKNPKATDLDRENFQKTLPSVVRRVAIPFWKSQFVKNDIAFLEGQAQTE